MLQVLYLQHHYYCRASCQPTLHTTKDSPIAQSALQDWRTESLVKADEVVIDIVKRNRVIAPPVGEQTANLLGYLCGFANVHSCGKGYSRR